jgi:hypothetical protein
MDVCVCFDAPRPTYTARPLHHHLGEGVERAVLRGDAEKRRGARVACRIRSRSHCPCRRDQSNPDVSLLGGRHRTCIIHRRTRMRNFPLLLRRILRRNQMKKTLPLVQHTYGTHTYICMRARIHICMQNFALLFVRLTVCCLLVTIAMCARAQSSTAALLVLAPPDKHAADGLLAHERGGAAEFLVLAHEKNQPCFPRAHAYICMRICTKKPEKSDACAGAGTAHTEMPEE